MIEDILPHLKKVRKTGPSNWIACCPAHDDKNPSMTLKQQPDGTVSVHCFALCGFEAIVASVGLGYGPWFPEKTEPHKHVRAPYPAADILECIAEEAMIVWVVANDIAEGKEVPSVDRERINLANKRLQKAVEVMRGKR